MKIIDDDVDLSTLGNANDDDIEKFNMGEDAPQIVGVVDDRPPELIAREDYNKSRMWKTLGTDLDVGGENAGQMEGRARSKSPNINRKRNGNEDASPVRKRAKSGACHDASPPRKSNKNRNASSPRRRKQNDSSDGSSRHRGKSPARRSNRSRSSDESPPRKVEKDGDASPPRRRKQHDSPDVSSRRRYGSPSRRVDRGRSLDQSPPRKAEKDRDASPPRRRARNDSPDTSPRRRDGSPPRKADRRRSPDESPPRRVGKDRDASPPRRRERNNSPDASPRRRGKSPLRRPNRERVRDESPPRRANKDRDASPPRRKPSDSSGTPPRRQPAGFNYRTKQLSESPPPTHKKMVKTLDGKIAGLQNASALRDENEKFKKREDELYKHMTKDQPDEMEAQVRKTGRRRNLEQNSEKEMEKMRRAEERKAIYDRWGKGLKQIADSNERAADEKHEHSKPLARYANDADLDDYLKEQYREGDPMAEYFQNKSKEKGGGPSEYIFNGNTIATHTIRSISLSAKPIYQGSFAENRFNIRPGYRWDGVDRSNGYEKKWFQVQSQKKATEEEAYKYSVEDM